MNQKIVVKEAEPIVVAKAHQSLVVESMDLNSTQIGQRAQDRRGQRPSGRTNRRAQQTFYRGTATQSHQV